MLPKSDIQLSRVWLVRLVQGASVESEQLGRLSLVQFCCVVIDVMIVFPISTTSWDHEIVGRRESHPCFRREPNNPRLSQLAPHWATARFRSSCLPRSTSHLLHIFHQPLHRPSYFTSLSACLRCSGVVSALGSAVRLYVHSLRVCRTVNFLSAYLFPSSQRKPYLHPSPSHFYAQSAERQRREKIATGKDGALPRKETTKSDRRSM